MHESILQLYLYMTAYKYVSLECFSCMSPVEGLAVEGCLEEQFFSPDRYMVLAQDSQLKI